jgi:hypothetical protein
MPESSHRITVQLPVSPDPKQLSRARLLIIIGVLSMAGSMALWRWAIGNADENSWILSAPVDIAIAFLDVVAGCALGVGGVGMIAHRLSDVSLKKIDFLWMLAASVSLVFALSQAIGSVADYLRGSVDTQLNSYRIGIDESSQMLMARLCRKPDLHNPDLCTALKGAHDWAVSVVRVPTSAQTNIICIPRSNDYSQDLGELCQAILLARALKNSRVHRDRDYYLLTVRGVFFGWWQYFLCLALGLRLSKSVIEVGWFQLGPPAHVPSPSDLNLDGGALAAKSAPDAMDTGQPI